MFHQGPVGASGPPGPRGRDGEKVSIRMNSSLPVDVMISSLYFVLNQGSAWLSWIPWPTWTARREGNYQQYHCVGFPGALTKQFHTLTSFSTFIYMWFDHVYWCPHPLTSVQMWNCIILVITL